MKLELISSFISADDHVLEQRDTWTSRMSNARWGERVPQVKTDAEGIDYWSVDGRRIPLAGSGSLGACVARRDSPARSWNDIAPAAYDPVERLKMMDSDGIAASVLYPMVAGIAGETFGASEDAEFALACVGAYNDYVIEAWASKSPRFIPQCIVPIASSELMVSEIRRAVGLGHRGLVLPATPSLLRDGAPMLNDPCFDPVWSICEELDIPVCFHIGASEKLRMPTYAGYDPSLAEAYRAITLPQSGMSYLPNFLVSGILERFRGLRAVFSGASAGMVQFVIETTDYLFESSKNSSLGYTRGPSEMFRDQCFAVGVYDENSTLRHACDTIGAATVLGGSEIPFGASTAPETQAHLADMLEGFSEEERHAIVTENVAKLYKIDVPTIIAARGKAALSVAGG